MFKIGDIVQRTDVSDRKRFVIVSIARHRHVSVGVHAEEGGVA